MHERHARLDVDGELVPFSEITLYCRTQLDVRCMRIMSPRFDERADGTLALSDSRVYVSPSFASSYTVDYTEALRKVWLAWKKTRSQGGRSGGLTLIRQILDHDELCGAVADAFAPYSIADLMVTVPATTIRAPIPDEKQA